MADSPHVIETTAERFQADVLDRSRETPVVVDFWAAWCQPCRMLAPLLERLANEYAGQFTLVKADTDQLPEQALAFGVQGIPAVYAVRDGQIVDSFTGLLSEAQLRQWLAGIVPTEAQRLVREAAAIESTDTDQAEKHYARAAELDPQLAAATIGLARVLLAQGRADEASELVEQLSGRGFLEPEAERLKAELSLRSSSASAGEIDALRQAASAAPNDARAKLKLAEALLAGTAYAEGLALCLEVVENHSGEEREAARKRMLDAFRLLGDDSDLTRDFRRRLALALY